MLCRLVISSRLVVGSRLSVPSAAGIYLFGVIIQIEVFILTSDYYLIVVYHAKVQDIYNF